MEKNNNDATAPKKGWFSKLAEGASKALFEEDNSVATDESKKTNNSVSNSESTTPSKFSYSDVNQSSGIPASMVIPNASGMFDQKFYDSFLQVIENNNVEGIDYFEFSKALQALSASGLAEPMRYQAAFSSLKANSNLTKDTLIKTADFYLDKLTQEETEFNAEMEHEVEVQVSSRMNQAKDKQDEIAAKQQEILKLQADMNTLQGEIGALNMEAQQIQGKIESTAKNFKVSLDVLRGQINLDKQNINTFIQN